MSCEKESDGKKKKRASRIFAKNKKGNNALYHNSKNIVSFFYEKQN